MVQCRDVATILIFTGESLLVLAPTGMWPPAQLHRSQDWQLVGGQQSPSDVAGARAT